VFVVFGGDPRQNLAAVSNITASCKLNIYYKHTLRAVMCSDIILMRGVRKASISAQQQVIDNHTS